HRALLVHDVDDTTGIERPEAALAAEDGDAASDLDGRVRPAQLDPAEMEHLPVSHRRHRPVEHLRATSELDARPVNRLARWRCSPRRPDPVVEKRLLSLRGQKAADLFVAGAAGEEHRKLDWLWATSPYSLLFTPYSLLRAEGRVGVRSRE